ncbi:MAG: hypothetical protein QM783_04990 [Phycisphaerales bacterium]
MHELHDDALERELTRLSEYSGSPTPVWEEALDAHRRERDRKLWVWVRRPAPALAAACLAVLVASVALRSPATERADEERGIAVRRQVVALGKSDRGDALLLPTGESAVGGGGGGRFGNGTGAWNSQVPSELTLDTRGLDNLTVRTTAPELNQLGWAGNSPPTSVRGVPPSDFDLDNAGADVYADKAPAVPPAPSTTVTLSVPDVNNFYYKSLPLLVNEKLGDQVADRQMLKAQAKDASDGVQFVLKVNENRLEPLLEELRKAGEVQVEQAESLNRQTRLSQIDARLENDKHFAARFAEAEKSKTLAAAPSTTNGATAPAPAGGGGGAGAGRAQAPHLERAGRPCLHRKTNWRQRGTSSKTTSRSWRCVARGSPTKAKQRPSTSSPCPRPCGQGKERRAPNPLTGATNWPTNHPIVKTP